MIGGYIVVNCNGVSTSGTKQLLSGTYAKLKNDIETNSKHIYLYNILEGMAFEATNYTIAENNITIDFSSGYDYRGYSLRFTNNDKVAFLKNVAPTENSSVQKEVEKS